MMFANYKKGIHQILTYTELDRYPEIFLTCSKLKEGDVKILSFGCSTGEECQTLRKYFPLAEIIGLDVNENVLKKAIKNNSDKKIKFHSVLNENSFDLIFCMSVFCRHINNGECDDPFYTHYTFKQFEKTLKELISTLKHNGAIIIYNSNFRFCDTKFSNLFKSIPTKDNHGSGFVTKFNKENVKLKNQIYKDCVFLKYP